GMPTAGAAAQSSVPEPGQARHPQLALFPLLRRPEKRPPARDPGALQRGSAPQRQRPGDPSSRVPDSRQCPPPTPGGEPHPGLPRGGGHYPAAAPHPGGAAPGPPAPGHAAGGPAQPPRRPPAPHDPAPRPPPSP